MDAQKRMCFKIEILPSMTILPYHHLSTTYKLLKFPPLALKIYLGTFVFPLVLGVFTITSNLHVSGFLVALTLQTFITDAILIEHHGGEKIASSGQDLDGDMLFSCQVGFCGMPSNLLPEEPGQCHYNQGVYGKIYHYLTLDSIMST